MYVLRFQRYLTVWSSHVQYLWLTTSTFPTFLYGTKFLRWRILFHRSDFYFQLSKTVETVYLHALCNDITFYLLYYYRLVTGYVIDSYSSISTFIQSFSLATPLSGVTMTMKLLCNHVYDVIFNADEFQQQRISYCVLVKNVQLADVLLIRICFYLFLFPLRFWDSYFSAINLYDLIDQETNFLARNMTAFIRFHAVFSVQCLRYVLSFRSILPTFRVLPLSFQRFSSFNIIDE